MIERTIKCGDKVFKRVTKTTFIKTVREQGKRFDYAMSMINMRFPLTVDVMAEIEERQHLYPDYTYEEQVKLAVEHIANTMHYYNANKDYGYTVCYYILQ